MKINTELLKKSKKGIVYILYIDLEYKENIYYITKIGVTTRKVEDRVVEILTDIWKLTRVFPKCYVKRFRTVDNPYELETELLAITPNKLDLDISFSGSTECFILDEEQKEILINFYEKATC